jgi:hypothetical protein
MFKESGNIYLTDVELFKKNIQVFKNVSMDVKNFCPFYFPIITTLNPFLSKPHHIAWVSTAVMLVFSY